MGFLPSAWPTSAKTTSGAGMAGGKPRPMLATRTTQRQASWGMDCDDCILLMAHPGEPSKKVAVHLAGCDTCRQLAEHLESDAEVSAVDNTAGNDIDDDLIGTDIGAYQIRELVGCGGMGRVYLAVHPAIGSRVAIKVFSKDWNEHPSLVARFFAEAHATNTIAHENIVNVLDVGRLDDGRPYLIMEYLLGVPLSKLVGSEALSDAGRTRILLDVLAALSAAHQHEIVHRDLKPDNIFVSPEGRATLLDFGIAKLMPEIGGDSAPTATGTVIGTPHYMSPEQAVGDPVDTRTDVYAMGVILYECFTGRRPFSGTSLYRLMDQHVNRVPTPPRELRPELGEDVEAVILKALAKAPEDRYSTTGEMRNALAVCECCSSNSVFSLSQGSAASSATRAETVAILAESAAPTAAAKSPRTSVTWRLFAGALIAGLGVGVILWNSPSKRHAAMPSDAATITTAVVIDAAPIAVTPDLPLPADADTVDASSGRTEKPNPIRRTATRKKPIGTPPLTLLEAATDLALNNKPDAILVGIRLHGLSRDGEALVPLGSGTSVASFDFLSPSMAANVAARGRERGICIVRVTYRSPSDSVVEQVGGTCDAQRPLSSPRCSLKTVMTRARKSGALPTEGSIGSAVLSMSSSRKSRRMFWKFSIGETSYNTPAC